MNIYIITENMGPGCGEVFRVACASADAVTGWLKSKCPKGADCDLRHDKWNAYEELPHPSTYPGTREGMEQRMDDYHAWANKFCDQDWPYDIEETEVYGA